MLWIALLSWSRSKLEDGGADLSNGTELGAHIAQVLIWWLSLRYHGVIICSVILFVFCYACRGFRCTCIPGCWCCAIVGSRFGRYDIFLIVACILITFFNVFNVLQSEPVGYISEPWSPVSTPLHVTIRRFATATSRYMNAIFMFIFWLISSHIWFDIFPIQICKWIIWSADWQHCRFVLKHKWIHHSSYCLCVLLMLFRLLRRRHCFLFRVVVFLYKVTKILPIIRHISNFANSVYLRWLCVPAVVGLIVFIFQGTVCY